MIVRVIVTISQLTIGEGRYQINLGQMRQTEGEELQKGGSAKCGTAESGTAESGTEQTELRCLA
jgi:hypothetical protein